MTCNGWEIRERWGKWYVVALPSLSGFYTLKAAKLYCKRRKVPRASKPKK